MPMVICVFKYNIICFFIKLGSAKLNTCMFKVLVSSKLTVLLIRMNHPSVSIRVSFSLGFILSNIRHSVSDTCLVWFLVWFEYFYPPFYSNMVPILYNMLLVENRWMNFVSWSLRSKPCAFLINEFWPLIFKVIIICIVLIMVMCCLCFQWYLSILSMALYFFPPSLGYTYFLLQTEILLHVFSCNFFLGLVCCIYIFKAVCNLKICLLQLWWIILKDILVYTGCHCSFGLGMHYSRLF